MPDSDHFNYSRCTSISCTIFSVASAWYPNSPPCLQDEMQTCGPWHHRVKGKMEKGGRCISFFLTLRSICFWVPVTTECKGTWKQHQLWMGLHLKATQGPIHHEWFNCFQMCLQMSWSSSSRQAKMIINPLRNSQVLDPRLAPGMTAEMKIISGKKGCLKSGRG